MRPGWKLGRLFYFKSVGKRNERLTDERDRDTLWTVVPQLRASVLMAKRRQDRLLEETDPGNEVEQSASF